MNRQLWEAALDTPVLAAGARNLLRELAPGPDLAHLVLDAVTALDLSAFMRTVEYGATADAELIPPAEPPIPDGGVDLCAITGTGLFRLGSQRQQIDLIGRLGQALRPGGVLVVEMAAATGEWLENARCRTVEVAPKELGMLLRRCDVATQTVEESWVRLIDSDLPRVQTWMGRYVAPGELDVIAELAGMEHLGRWADWERSPYVADSRLAISAFRVPAA
jgi:SAM-dependent methyltransferase